MAQADGFVPDRVRLGLVVSDLDDLFRAVAEDLRDTALIADAGAARRALAEREAVHSTALGGGIAIPHARSACCAAPRFFAARLAAPLSFGAPDGLPVDLVFVLLSPPHDPGAHVKGFARIARALRRPGVVEALRFAADEASFREALAGYTVTA